MEPHFDIVVEHVVSVLLFWEGFSLAKGANPGSSRIMPYEKPKF